MSDQCQFDKNMIYNIGEWCECTGTCCCSTVVSLIRQVESAARCRKWSLKLTCSIDVVFICLARLWPLFWAVTKAARRRRRNTAWDEKDGWPVKAEDMISVSVEHRRREQYARPSDPTPNPAVHHTTTMEMLHWGVIRWLKAPCCLSPDQKNCVPTWAWLIHTSLQLKQFVRGIKNRQLCWQSSNSSHLT